MSLSVNLALERSSMLTALIFEVVRSWKAFRHRGFWTFCEFGQNDTGTFFGMIRRRRLMRYDMGDHEKTGLTRRGSTRLAGSLSLSLFCYILFFCAW